MILDTSYSQRTVVSTFASPHEPTLKPKACKRASAFTTHLGKAILSTAQKKQNKFVLVDRLVQFDNDKKIKLNKRQTDGYE